MTKGLSILRSVVESVTLAIRLEKHRVAACKEGVARTISKRIVAFAQIGADVSNSVHLLSSWFGIASVVSRHLCNGADWYTLLRIGG